MQAPATAPGDSAVPAGVAAPPPTLTEAVGGAVEEPLGVPVGLLVPPGVAL